jgi:hypothetical protein
VIVRVDPTLRGKSYAVNFAIRHLERNRPDIVIVVDADCSIARGSIDQLARLCARTGCRISRLGTGRFRELGTTMKGSPAEP